VGFKLFSLSGDVTADTSPADRRIAALQSRIVRLQGQIEGMSSRFSAAFRSPLRAINALANGTRSATTGTRGLYAALSAASATAIGIGLLRKAVGGASDLYESMTKAKQVFGDATATITDGADRMASKFGVVNQLYLDSASNLGLIAKASGLTEDAAASLAKRLTESALDASSFFNTNINETLMAFRAGLVGESEPMRRFGVLLSEAAVQNEAFRLGLARSKAELTDGVKVQARASIMFRQLADSQGDLARTSSGMANSWRALTGRITNTLTKFGGAILPIFQAAVEVANDWLEKLAGYLEKNILTIIGWANKVGGIIKIVGLVWDQWPKMVEIATLKVQEIILQLVEGVSRIGATLWEGLTYGWETGVTILKNAFSGLGKYLTTLFDTIGKNIVASLNDALVDLATGPLKKMAMLLSALNPTLGAALSVHIGAIEASGKMGPNAPKIGGDSSGLTDAALMKGVKPPPDFMAKFKEPLPNLANLIDPLVDALHHLVGLKVVGGALQAFVDRLGTPMSGMSAATRFNRDTLDRAKSKFLMSPLARQTEENQRKAARKLGVPFLRNDEQGNRQAARSMDARRRDDARKGANAARQNLAKRDFGGMGVVVNGVSRAVQAISRAAGLDGNKAGAAGKIAATIAGGLSGVGAAIQADLKGGGSRGRTGQPGRSRGRTVFPWDMQPRQVPGAGQPFRSEFRDLKSLSSQIATNSLSRDGKNKDPNTNILSGIAQGIGTNNAGAGSNSVVGLLQKIAGKQGGPGFAVGPA
jgi:hypothetical protein